MKKRYMVGKIIALGIMSAVLLTGCGSSNSSYDKSASYAPEEAYEEAGYGVYESAMEAEDYADNSAGSGSDSVGQVQNNENRKLITTVHISAETEDMDKSLGAIESKVSGLGGYIENSDIDNGSYSSRISRRASLTIRIPAQNLDEFIEVIEGGNNITNKSVNVEDVTLSYVDIESKKNSLRTEEKRLLEILQKAETVEDLIIIEDKLASVRYEIESIESQLRSYDNKVDYSTIFLKIDEVVTFTPVEKEGALTRMGRGFMESFGDVVDGIVEFFVWLVVHIPQLVMMIIVIIIIVIICKVIVKSGKKRKAKKLAKMQAHYQAQVMQGMNPAQAMHGNAGQAAPVNIQPTAPINAQPSAPVGAQPSAPVNEKPESENKESGTDGNKQ